MTINDEGKRTFSFLYKMLVILIFFLVSSLFLLTLFFNKNSNYESTADGFKIENYDVVLNVQEDNKIYVTENITVQFTRLNKHGIYRFIPEWLEYTSKDGKKLKRRAVISDLIALNDPYTIDSVSNDKKNRIKIGSPYSYEKPFVDKKYTISYIYDMGKDPYKNFDEFIFHAFGDYWGTEIKNASIEVIMPKDISNSKINFFMDKDRKFLANKYVDYKVYDNKLYASFNSSKDSEIKLNKSLTVDIELPEGYFVGGSNNYNNKSFIISVVIIIITIINLLIWNKYGKDLPKRLEVIEYYPPKEYNSAQIGYIYGTRSQKRLSISLIVELASKGYIKIDEITKDSTNKILLTNLVIKPKEPILNDKINKRIIRIRKLKEISDDLNKKEISMMKYLFKLSNEREIRTNIEKFLNVRDNLINKGYIQIISDNEKEIYNKYNESLKKYEKEKMEYENDIKVYNDIISNMPILTELEQLVIDEIFYSSNEVILSESTSFYMTGIKIKDILKKEFDNLITSEISIKKMDISLTISLANLILSIISFNLVQDLNPKFYILYYISFACIFINIIITCCMKKRTEYGDEILNKIKSFRKFLLTVEKDKIESLVEKNPNYFYDILPYTYVLNISKKWIKKFEEIPIPKDSTGNYNFQNIDSFYGIYTNINSFSSTGSSSGGCSSCGGGCSSCGGGCSSCGGGGSW